MSGPLSTPGARPTLILALAMSTIGFLGLFRSANALGTGHAEVAQSMDASRLHALCGNRPDVDVPRAADALARVSTDAAALQFTRPERRAEHAANVLASILLLIASIFLVTRRRTALWWTSQALFANVLYTALSIGVELRLRSVHGAAFHRLALAWQDALVHTGCLPPAPADAAAAQVLAWTVVTIGLSLLAAVVYLLLWRLSRMQTVQRFLAGAS